jgi:GT2 family glycosyltransferase
VVPEKGYIAHLLRHFEDEAVFSVGCKEIEVVDGQEFVSGRTVGRFSRGFLVHSRAEKQVTGVTFWNFGGSMAASRAKYLELDGMDELYAPAYWEDIDLGYRAMQRGWKNIFEEKAVVYHKHETTNVSVFGRRKLELMSFRNQILFVWKNIRGWQLVEHFLWLPYHLLFTTLRSKGLFLVAMLQAIWRWMSFPRGAEEIESVEE